VAGRVPWVAWWEALLVSRRRLRMDSFQTTSGPPKRAAAHALLTKLAVGSASRSCAGSGVHSFSMVFERIDHKVNEIGTLSS
jgi:hypothetical protein